MIKVFFTFISVRKTIFTALALLLLSACSVKRDTYHLPPLSLPPHYPKSQNAVDGSHAPPLPSQTSVAASLLLNARLTEWWRLLGSPELNSLMDRALANNQDLRIGTLRIAQSKARLSQAGAATMPTLSLPVQSDTSYPESGVGISRANGINKARTISQFGLRADWRPDIWGESAALYDSAEMQLLRATCQRDDMQRNVVAQVVVTYIEYLSVNDRLRVSEETETSLREMLESVAGRLKVGDATITEMEQQNAAVYSVKATIPVLRQQRELLLNRLAGLLGSAPVELILSDKGLNSIRFPQVLPDMPSSLLLRRPDIRAAEYRLLSADADIDVARARILPPLDLSAQIGYGSMYLSRLFLPQSLFWSTIGNLSASIFDAGRRAKEVDFAVAVHEELLETYIRVVYDAVREVDDSLSALTHVGERIKSQNQAVEASLRAWNYSRETFMAGAVDYPVLLETQRTYQRHQDDWYTVQMDRYRNLVNLFNGLGGGIANNDLSTDEETRIRALTGTEITASSGKRDQAGIKREEGYRPGSIDWSGRILESGGDQWLVELPGVYDVGAILPAWRDLKTRFPDERQRVVLLPQRQGHIMVRDKERAAWYRLFVAGFSEKKNAEEFCAVLTVAQQRCTIMASDSIAGKGDFVPPAALAQLDWALAWDHPPVNASESPPPEGGGEKASPPNTAQEAAGDHKDLWFVALSDSYNRDTITAAWQNLLVQFPVQMKDKTVLPRRRPQLEAGQEHTPRYRLLIGTFPEKEGADEFCSMLTAEQRRCSVISLQSNGKVRPVVQSPTNATTISAGTRP